MSLQATFSNDLLSLMLRRAEELHARGLREGVLDEATFGELMLYIGYKPASVLVSIQVQEGPLAGITVHAGGEEA